jgi:hypothetical protein
MIRNRTISSSVMVKGLHYEEFCEEGKLVKKELVTVEIDGQEYDRFWSPETRMEPYFIDYVLDDMGVGEAGLNTGRTDDAIKVERKAVKDYCLQYLKLVEVEDKLLSLGEVQMLAGYFWEGYRKAIELNHAEA